MSRSKWRLAEASSDTELPLTWFWGSHENLGLWWCYKRNRRISLICLPPRKFDSREAEIAPPGLTCLLLDCQRAAATALAYFLLFVRIFLIFGHCYHLLPVKYVQTYLYIR